MNFIHKKDVVPVEIGEYGRKVAATFKHRPRRTHKVDAQLGRHDLRQRGFAKTGVAVKKRVVKGLAALTGCAKVHAQVGAQLVLPDKIVKAARANAFVNARAAVCGAGKVLIGWVRHQALPLASALREARSAPVTSRSGSSSSSFLTSGAHSSGS